MVFQSKSDKYYLYVIVKKLRERVPSLKDYKKNGWNEESGSLSHPFFFSKWDKEPVPVICPRYLTASSDSFFLMSTLVTTNEQMARITSKINTECKLDSNAGPFS